MEVCIQQCKSLKLVPLRDSDYDPCYDLDALETGTTGGFADVFLAVDLIDSQLLHAHQAISEFSLLSRDFPYNVMPEAGVASLLFASASIEYSSSTPPHW
jgi:hypothetical protein